MKGPNNTGRVFWSILSAVLQTVNFIRNTVPTVLLKCSDGEGREVDPGVEVPIRKIHSIRGYPTKREEYFYPICATSTLTACFVGLSVCCYAMFSVPYRLNCNSDMVLQAPRKILP